MCIYLTSPSPCNTVGPNPSGLMIFTGIFKWVIHHSLTIFMVIIGVPNFTVYWSQGHGIFQYCPNGCESSHFFTVPSPAGDKQAAKVYWGSGDEQAAKVHWEKGITPNVLWLPARPQTPNVLWLPAHPQTPNVLLLPARPQTPNVLACFPPDPQCTLVACSSPDPHYTLVACSSPDHTFQAKV